MTEPQQKLPTNPAPAPPVADRPPAIVPEIVEHEQEALAVRHAETALLARIQSMPDGKVLVEQRALSIVTMRKAAIAITSPTDWILFKDAAGAETALLRASGAMKVRPFYDIAILPRGWPAQREFKHVRIDYGGGVFSYRMEAIVRSGFTGIETEVWAECRSDEPFTGRQVDAGGAFAFKTGTAYGPDLLQATFTRLNTKGVRVGTALAGVARSELDEVWGNRGKSTDQCPKGHGYGSSQDRRAQGVAEPGVSGPAGAEALWNDILKRVGGDESAAHDLLREITSYPAGVNRNTKREYKAFAGVKSWQEITREDSLKIAWKKLKEHVQWGDGAQQDREPGEDG